MLEKNIPQLLQQDYPNFEIVVVNEASTDDTEDALKRMPEAAPRGEWVVLTKPDCQPSNPRRLQTLAEFFFRALQKFFHRAKKDFQSVNFFLRALEFSV